MLKQTACVMDIAIIHPSIYHSVTASSGHRSSSVGLYVTRLSNKHNYFY
jgi:hypothetical protein